MLCTYFVLICLFVLLILSLTLFLMNINHKIKFETRGGRYTSSAFHDYFENKDNLLLDIELEDKDMTCTAA